MELDKKETRQIITLALIAILGLLTLILLRPVFMAIIGGLFLAYIFLPIYKKINIVIKNKNLAASLVLVILAIIIIVPLWFLIPIMTEQVFSVFSASQQIDVYSFFERIFPTASQGFLTQLSVSVNGIISDATSLTLNFLVRIFKQAPIFVINAFIVGFVFFFTLRDEDKLREFVMELSPLTKSKEKFFVKQFKDITDSIVYGQIIIGIIQGILAGLGLIIFGVPNALLLTLLAIFFSIIPVLGPFIVYLPVALLLFAQGDANIAIGYLLYNLFIVSTVDNFLRAYIVARKTRIHTAIIFVGMIGGLLIFGIMGLLLGPLILAYFLIILQLYKEKALQSLFIEENPEQGAQGSQSFEK